MDQALIPSLVTKAAKHSDMTLPALQFLAETFLAAHERAPGGLSIEVGTRQGGSAWLMLELLAAKYGLDGPMLFTVDPYGCKPYKSGTPGAPPAGIYGSVDHVLMKRFLADYAGHAHFYLTSREFFTRCLGATYWYRGEKRIIGHLTFVLLDGDHDAASIFDDVKHLRAVIAPGGRILIDNADKDPVTVRMLQGWTGPVHYGPKSALGAQQMVLEKR